MKTPKTMKRISFILLAGLSLFALLPSCKKSSGGNDSGVDTSGYYLIATINGQTWAANVANNSMNTPVLAALTGSGSSTLALTIGLKAAGKDTSAIALVFPENITLNKMQVFNASKYMEAIYLSNATTEYETSTNVNSDDSLEITTFDQSAKVIAGSFKGTFYLSTGGGTVKITDGKFKTPYVNDASELPPNVKF